MALNSLCQQEITGSRIKTPRLICNHLLTNLILATSALAHSRLSDLIALRSTKCQVGYESVQMNSSIN